MSYTNPGPGSSSTTNTQSPYSTSQFVQTIGVQMTPAAVATITTAEQSFGLNGVTNVTAATGIRQDDVILSVSAPSLVAGVGIVGWRNDGSVDDKFYLSFTNPTAGSVTPVAGIYLVTVARYNASTLGPATLAGLPTNIT